METAVRWHGSAWHGTKTAANVLSTPIVLEGLNVKVFSGFPFYPDELFGHLTIKSVNPSTTVVLNTCLAERTDFASHSHTWDIVFINSLKPPEVSQKKLDLHDYQVSAMGPTGLRYGMGYKC